MPNKFLSRCVRNASPTAFHARVAGANIRDRTDVETISMAWFAHGSRKYIFYAALWREVAPDDMVAAAEAVDIMRAWCRQTLHYIPHPVFLGDVVIPDFPDTLHGNRAAACLWSSHSHHLEFRNAGDAAAFVLRFGYVIENADADDENRSWLKAAKNSKRAAAARVRRLASASATI